MLTSPNETFSTEELYWDMGKHEIYSHKHMHIVTPEEELEGNSFRSNEQMTDYVVSWASGLMPVPRDEQADTTDTLPPRMEPAIPVTPQPATRKP